MSLAIVQTRAQTGITAPPVQVEVHLSNGLPSLSIVGLPETAVKESKDRVRSALLNSHFEFPTRRITVNLAPADLPKEGGRFDLAIALGILAASEQIPPQSLTGLEFLGELALSGELRPVSGILPASMACGRDSHRLIIPTDNGTEASLCETTRCYTAGNLLQVCAYLHGREDLPQPPPCDEGAFTTYPDMADVRGQAQAKRALEIAAAGNHNLLFFGPPGTGKTMLASRLPGILPPLEKTAALEAAAVHSISHGRVPHNWRQRPYRSPHHTASAVALVGGGSNPQPGEISLAHQGVLFLDELPEFQRQVLEVLREPLESGVIHISRANAQVAFPARFQLIAAMNPCPCGYADHNNNRCRCTPDQVARYRRKISGPLLDRVDLHVKVPTISAEELQQLPEGETSQVIRQRVVEARRRQLQRQGQTNQQLAGNLLEAHCSLNHKQQQLLARAIDKMGLSARAYHRCLRVARTLADLSGETQLSDQHLAEALSYRESFQTM